MKRKVCIECEKSRIIDEFPLDSRGRHRSRCKPCEFERTKTWPSRSPDRVRSRDLKYKYGITLEQFNAMLVAQGGVCAICLEAVDRWHLDHRHSCCVGQRTCGECIRAILCPPCNQMLGLVQERLETLRSAVRYLELFGT